MKQIDKLRQEGVQAFVRIGDNRWEELAELKLDAERAKQDYDRLCAVNPAKKGRYLEQLRDTEWVIERALVQLMGE